MRNHRRNAPIKGLYAITPDQPDTAELLHKVRLALQGGARVLQYRNKAADAALRLEQASALRELTQEFSVPLIINDDAMLARRVGADGVHLGGEDGSVDAARAVLGSAKLIGVSCYNRMELAHEAIRQGADYVAFGSFFTSAVKPDAVTASPELVAAGVPRDRDPAGSDRRYHGTERSAVAGCGCRCTGGDIGGIWRGGYPGCSPTVFKFGLFLKLL